MDTGQRKAASGKVRGQHPSAVRAGLAQEFSQRAADICPRRVPRRRSPKAVQFPGRRGVSNVHIARIYVMYPTCYDLAWLMGRGCIARRVTALRSSTEMCYRGRRDGSCTSNGVRRKRLARVDFTDALLTAINSVSEAEEHPRGPGRAQPLTHVTQPHVMSAMRGTELRTLGVSGRETTKLRRRRGHLGLFATLQETASRTGNSEGDGVEGSWEAKVVIPERWEGYRRWSRSRQEELQVREDRADKAACTTLACIIAVLQTFQGSTPVSLVVTCVKSGSRSAVRASSQVWLDVTNQCTE